MKNRIWRLIPADRWEMGTIEGWLEEMAGQGWILEKCGRYFATFERWEPRPCRFRLEPLGTHTPSRREETEAGYAELGWRLLCPMGDLLVFYCLHPAAPELQTDPVAEGWLVEKLLKRTRRHLLWAWLFLLGCFAVWGLLLLRSQTPVADLVLGTDAEIILGCLLLPWLAWETVRALKRIRRMRRQTAAGFPRTHTGDWKKSRRQAAAGLAILLLFYALWLGYPLWQFWTADAQRETEMPHLMGYQLDPSLEESRQSSDLCLEDPSFLSPVQLQYLGDIQRKRQAPGPQRVLLAALCRLGGAPLCRAGGTSPGGLAGGKGDGGSRHGSGDLGPNGVQYLPGGLPGQGSDLCGCLRRLGS